MFKLIKKMFCCKVDATTDDAVLSQEDVKDESLTLKNYGDKRWPTWFNLGIEETITENEDGSELVEFLVPEEKERKPLSEIKRGDAVVYYEFCSVI